MIFLVGDSLCKVFFINNNNNNNKKELASFARFCFRIFAVPELPTHLKEKILRSFGAKNKAMSENSFPYLLRTAPNHGQFTLTRMFNSR